MREIELKIPAVKGNTNLLNYFRLQVEEKNKTSYPVRFVVTKTDSKNYHCEIGILDKKEERPESDSPSIFDFRQRKSDNGENFNILFLVPTGIGAEIGGHAGDATPVLRMLASICDNIITHPNVVNASDINEMTDNTIYVEGSVITRLIMGTIGLQKVRSNRVLVVINDNEKNEFIDMAINSINAARAVYGLNCPTIVRLKPHLELNALTTESGRASGNISGLSYLFEVLDDLQGKYDALALTSDINVQSSTYFNYFSSKGKIVNPQGGIEALLTHAVSMLYSIPSAHSPMFVSEEISNKQQLGVVDPRMAGEAISLSFLQCILKGLQKSPRIITGNDLMNQPGLITANDISCLVIPNGCLGIPTLAALDQGIKVISVNENSNLMRNDLSKLPWQSDQFYEVENYLEAAGIIASLKSGLDPKSVRRPFPLASVQRKVID